MLLAANGFLGFDAPLRADLTLLAYLLFLVPVMLIGFMFARRKMFEPHHKFIMTSIVIFNWVLIIFIMAVSYSDSVAPNVGDDPGNRFFLIPTIHLIFGAAAQLLGTYLVIRMWFEDQLPDWFKVKRIKRYMRLTLGLWLATALLGALIYFVWYVDDPDTAEASDNVPGPNTTEEAVDGVVPPDATEDPVIEPPAATEEADDDSDDDNNDDDSDDDDDDDDSDGDDDDDDDDDVESPAATEEAAGSGG